MLRGRTRRVVTALAMSSLGVLHGMHLRSAWAESVVCGSYRYQTVELTEPTVEFLEGDGNLDAERNRWTDAEITPASVHELSSAEMLVDGRLQFDGLNGYNVDGRPVILLPQEGS